MKKRLRVVILMASIMLFFVQKIVEAKYVVSYENTIAQICIDNMAPIIEGVEENGIYNQNITITYYDNIQVESAVYYYNNEKEDFDVEAQKFESGHVFSEEGYYKIIITDTSGNQAQIQTFLIDKTSPQIIGVENGVIYDLPPNIEYYDKYGIEKIEITTEEELELEYQYENSNRRPISDRTSTTLTVHVSYSPKTAIEYKWYIKKEADLEYQLIATNLENEFTFTELEPNTKYNIYCIANTSDNKSYISNLVSAQTIQIAQKVEIIDIFNTGYKIKVTGIADDYKYIYFPTWTDANGQDDIIWYQYQLTDDEFTFTLDHQNHNMEQGKYHTHVYIQKEEAAYDYIQSTYVYVGQEEPEKQKVDFTGKIDVTVTDIAGNVTNTNYFVDKIVTISLSQTYGKNSYSKLKEILNDNMESFEDETYTINVKQSKLDKIKRLEITNYIDQEGLYFSGLNYFRKLEYLDISGSTRFKTEEIKTLSNLKYLDISNGKDYIYDLSFLNQLQNLEYLNTTGTNITNEEVIQTLPNLKEWKN